MSVSLGAIALKFGLPIVVELLNRKGGKSGAMAGKVVSSIAEGLGVAPREQSIVEKYKAEPRKVETIMRKVETDFAEIARATADATISYHALIAGDRNSSSLVTRIWRPMNALFFGVECLGLMAVIIKVVWSLADGGSIDLTGAGVLVGLVIPMLTLQAGVTGYYVHRRSIEKMDGTA